MILLTSRGPEDWRDRLARPDLHWKPGRSAMEAALAWEGASGLPDEIAALFPEARLIQAIVEYPVDLPGGRRPSLTDVFALIADREGQVAVMVEAKRDESFSPTLGEWRKDDSPGKADRLSFLCKPLGLGSGRLADTLRYQLLHRTASAILAAQHYGIRRAAMVVQSFSPEHAWLDDFVQFAALFGVASPARDRLHDAGMPSGIALCLGWASAFQQDTPV